MLITAAESVADTLALMYALSISAIVCAESSLAAIAFVTVVAKLASSPNAAASSFNVSRVLGAVSTNAATAASIREVTPVESIAVVR